MVGFPANLSPISFHLSPTCGRVPGRLVSYFLLFVSHFFSFVTHFFLFVSQAGCLWSGSRPACLPVSQDEAFLFICLPDPSLLVPCSISIHLSLSLLISALFRWPCSISIHLSPRLVTGGVRHFPLFLFICLPALSLLVSALFRWPCSISIHLSPRSVTASVLFPKSVTAGVRPFRRPCSISIH